MQPDYDVSDHWFGVRRQCHRVAAHREGLPRRRPRGRPPLRRRGVRQDLVEPAQVPLDAQARHVRHPADPLAAQRHDPGRRGRRRRIAELRQHAVRAAGPVLQRPAVEEHHRLACRVDAPLRPGAAHARRGREPDVHRCRQGHERGRRRHGRRRHLRRRRRSGSSSGRTARRLRARPFPTRTSAAQAPTAPAVSNAGRA